jgi:hypothetical protein
MVSGLWVRHRSSIPSVTTPGTVPTPRRPQLRTSSPASICKPASPNSASVPTPPSMSPTTTGQAGAALVWVLDDELTRETRTRISPSPSVPIYMFASQYRLVREVGCDEWCRGAGTSFETTHFMLDHPNTKPLHSTYVPLTASCYLVLVFPSAGRLTWQFDSKP